MKHENEIGKLQQKERQLKKKIATSQQGRFGEKIKTQQKKSKEEMVELDLARGKETIVQMKNFINSDVNQEYKSAKSNFGFD